jgi:NAD(P)-dependent dehydrogenase (short-subunit alcohol dehydrogenase family)
VTARDTGALDGRVVVVTGASAGIGAAAAVELARRGATVVPVGRNRRRLEAVAKRAGGDAEPLSADFASLAEVRRLAAELLDRHERIDVLVNNAGLVMGRCELTEDGYERTFAVNHLAPFLLTNLLIERLKASAPARVVTTSSDAHLSGHIDLGDLHGERSWSSWGAYGASKLANVLFTRELARRLEGSGVTANCLHPGVVRTSLERNMGWPMRIGWTVAKPFFASPRSGASTIVYLASSPDVAGTSGGYFARSRPARCSLEASDDMIAAELWNASERLVGLA